MVCLVDNAHPIRYYVAIIFHEIHEYDVNAFMTHKRHFLLCYTYVKDTTSSIYTSFSSLTINNSNEDTYTKDRSVSR